MAVGTRIGKGKRPPSAATPSPLRVWLAGGGATVVRVVATALGKLTLFQRFMILTLLILVVGAYIIGSYVAAEIKDRVIQRTSAITALYVDSFISPHLQELSEGQRISPAHFEQLDALLNTTSLGQKIVSFKVWNPQWQVVYASDPRLVGRIFRPESGLQAALAGDIHTDISSLGGEENLFERDRWGRLLETYAPIRADESGRIIGVSEFYQDPQELIAEIAGSQRKGWLIVGTSTAVMYVLLVGMVKGASNTIGRQHRRLEALVAQNSALAERVRRAAAQKSETDERLLMRIAHDLHDGPAQDLGLGLLRIDALKRKTTTGHGSDDWDVVRNALQNALDEVRQISAGIRLPELDKRSLAGVVEQAVLEHTQNTGNRVQLTLASDLDMADLPLKIAVYRVAQEALNNAYLHAGIDEQEVELSVNGNQLSLEIRDRGVGFAMSTGQRERGRAHSPLGLRGMRERVELLSGTLEVFSEEGKGTTVRALIPLPAKGGSP